MPPLKTTLFSAVAMPILWAAPISADTETETTETEVETVAEETTEATVSEEVEVAAITGDVKKGKRVFKKCKACHKFKADKNGPGPTLYKIIGRKSAQIADFKYSKAMEEADLTWDVETLTEYLRKPAKFVRGTSMTFPGLKKDKDIENVIAYLDDVSKDD